MFRTIITAVVAVAAFSVWQKGAVTCDVHRDRIDNIRQSWGITSNNMGDGTPQPLARWNEPQSFGPRTATSDPVPLHGGR